MERHERKTPALVINNICLCSTCIGPLTWLRSEFGGQWDALTNPNIIEYMRREHLTPWGRIMEEY